MKRSLAFAYCCFLAIAASFISVTVEGCVFYWQGSQVVGAQSHLPPIYLSTEQPYSQFTRYVKQKMHEANIPLVLDKTTAPVKLKIIKSYTHYPSVGNYYGIESRFYNLTYYVDYAITLDRIAHKRHLSKSAAHKGAPHKGATHKAITKTGKITVVRSIIIKRNEAIDSTAQLPVIVREMREEAARRLLMRVRRHIITLTPEIGY